MTSPPKSEPAYSLSALSEASPQSMLRVWLAHMEGFFRTSVRLHPPGGLRGEHDLAVEVVSGAIPDKLAAAIEYTLHAGGKRLRPLLVIASAAAARRSEVFVDDAMAAALAVEFVHTYSLIHDDLPALDNDDVRRGRPSLHKAFGEATAILAGDALLTDAFALLSRAPTNAAAQMAELARAAGSAGMVGGQFDDVASGPKDLATLTSIHARKTGALFTAACAMGALSVDAPNDVVERLREFGRRFGLAFQIADDVIDITSGRGRDAANAKHTFATALGVEAATKRMRAEADAAIAIARDFKSAVLQELVEQAANRER